MKRNVEKYDYQVLNDAKNILMEIDMPKELYNPRCVMIFCACAQMIDGKSWRHISEEYMSVHDIIKYVNDVFPNKAGLDKKGYQENSRETFRDETLKRWVSAAIIESKAGLAANDRDSFISTYEEMERGLIPRKKKLDLNDPGIYSTSCNIDFSEAQYALNIFMRHYPKPFIAKGQTEVGCGPCQLTSERDKSKEGTHVDWWIYEKSDPQNYFKEVKENE